MIEQVYNQYYDTAGNYHWIGVYSGEHIVRKGERMTREEALEILEAIYFLDEKKQKAFNMAIEALEEAKKREETWDWCTDCKEYDHENHCCHRMSNVIYDTLCGTIVSGEWIPVEDSDWWRGFLCSVCNKAVNQRENYCPNCGASMKEVEDEI